MRQIRDLCEPKFAGYFLGIPIITTVLTDRIPSYVYDHEGD